MGPPRSQASLRRPNDAMEISMSERTRPALAFGLWLTGGSACSALFAWALSVLTSSSGFLAEVAGIFAFAALAGVVVTLASVLVGNSLR